MKNINSNEKFILFEQMLRFVNFFDQYITSSTIFIFDQTLTSINNLLINVRIIVVSINQSNNHAIRQLFFSIDEFSQSNNSNQSRLINASTIIIVSIIIINQSIIESLFDSTQSNSMLLSTNASTISITQFTNIIIATIDQTTSFINNIRFSVNALTIIIVLFITN